MTRIRPIVLAAAILSVPAGVSAQVPPDLDWRTLESEHFRVTFAPGLEPLARRAAGRAEAVYSILARELTEPPDGTIDIVLADNVGFSNGFASPLPTNRITIFVKPPVGHLELGYFERWIDLVVTHELVHIFHFDQTDWLGSALRFVFGRVPFGWPFFPPVFTPSWSTEGLATVYESRLGGAGRLYGSYPEMVVRTAVLEKSFPEISNASGSGPTWPGGSSRYIFGSHFLAYIADQYGPGALSDIVEETATTIIPPSFPFDRMAERAFGESFTDAWEDWHHELATRYGRLADSLRAAGLTRPERLTAAGRYAAYPRVSPDARRIAFAGADGRSPPSTRLIDRATGAITTVQERNQAGSMFGPASWMPDARRLVVPHLEYSDPYHVYQDLYLTRLDGGEVRLTEGMRLSAPHVAPDGRTIVSVQWKDGRNRLVVYDIETDQVRALTRYAADRLWSFPQWSPDGSRIAVALWRPGAYQDVVVLDSTGAVLRELTHDRAIDSAPTWSPDGRYVLFWSDRSGIPNLYAYDLREADAAAANASGSASSGSAYPDGTSSGSAYPDSAAVGAAASADGPLYQVTNVLSGAFFPDVSPDGESIFFSIYHADGFHVATLPFESGRWREPAPVAIDFRESSPELADAPGIISGPRSYSPIVSLLPRFWLPTLESGDAGTFVGAFTTGADLVGRHSYVLSAGYAPGPERFQGSVDYRYAGFGNPVLRFSGSQDWDGIGTAVTPEGREIAVLERERRLALEARLLRPRWRSSARLTIGGEWIAQERSLDSERFVLPDGVPDSDRLLGAFARASYFDANVYPYSISREDGRFLAIDARRRWDLNPFPVADSVSGGIIDGSYYEATADARRYFSFPLFGFADHVLALRAAGLARTGDAPPATGIGGEAGGTLGLGVDVIGGSGDFLPVRGYGDGARAGTRAWVASVEYRFPILLMEEGYKQWPIQFDRASGALFLDAGNAGCPGGFDSDPIVICREGPILAGAGGELRLEIGLLRFRGGVAWPLRGQNRKPRYYLVTGRSF